MQEKLEDIQLSQNVISNVMPTIEEGYAISGNRTPKTIVYSKVMCMEEIIKSKGENSKELISYVQQSDSVDELMEFMRQNGIEVNPERLASLPEFELSQKKKDEWVKEFCLDGEEWDNTPIINYMIANKRKIMNVKEKVSFIDKIKSGKGIGKILHPYYKSVLKIRKAFNSLLNKKSKEPLLLNERTRRKNRRTSKKNKYQAVEFRKLGIK